MNDTNNQLSNELNQFQNIWHGGYFTGYSDKRNQKGLEEYLKNNLSGDTLLEIGCGGGQWSKLIYDLKIFKKIHCIDALSEQHNKFWEFVGNSAKDKIMYTKVSDFELSFLEENSIDVVFSYDVFCHISYSGTDAYLKSLKRVCKPGAKLILMYADAEKYLNNEPENRSHVIRYLPKKKFIYNFSKKTLIRDAIKDSDSNPVEPRWFWIGIDQFVELCQKYEFTIINKDLNIDKTNPITLFKK